MIIPKPFDMPLYTPITGTLRVCSMAFLFLIHSLLPRAEAQTQESVPFEWDSHEIDHIRNKLSTRDNLKILVEIPIPQKKLKYQIGAQPYITLLDQVDETDLFLSFKGRDSIGNPIFGYFQQDMIHLFFYHEGQLRSVRRVDNQKDLYVVKTHNPSREKIDACNLLLPPGVKVRKGGNSLPCQTQNYTTWTLNLYLACTGEWGAYYGGEKAEARAALLQYGSLLNAFYTAEMGIEFNLITDERSIFTNPADDPFAPEDTTTNQAEEARQFFYNEVDPSLFDLGHVFHRTNQMGYYTSGIAYLRSLCSDTYKGGGWTATSRPEEFEFTFGVFGHEIAHQLGANHTFYGTDGNCAGDNRSAGDGFEPGSGTSLMSYERQCGDHDLDGPVSKRYYLNTHSVQEIISFLNETNCGIKTVGNVTLPVEIAGDFSVPLHTAFELQATHEGSFDFVWEQYDTDFSNSHADPLEAGSFTSTPMFRSYDPSPEGYYRAFPSRTVQREGPIRGEVFATVPRDITLRLMTRRPGRIQCDETTVTVRDASPFEILHPVPGEVIELAVDSGGNNDKLIVHWETGDTENHGFPTANILYSTNGGLTFPYVLAENIPNTGTFAVRPPLASDRARLKVQLTDGTGRMAIYHEHPDNFSVNFSLLPIQIVSFTGLPEDNFHLISWKLNNIGEFVRRVNLEYSFDGVDYHAIPLEGHEILNTELMWSGSYRSTFTQSPRTFYRLAIENQEAFTVYSPVVPIDNQPTDDLWNIYPNPANQEVQITFAAFPRPDAALSVRTLDGKKIYTLKMEEPSRAWTVPLNFPDGMYILELINDGVSYYKKLVIQAGN